MLVFFWVSRVNERRRAVWPISNGCLKEGKENDALCFLSTDYSGDASD